MFLFVKRRHSIEMYQVSVICKQSHMLPPPKASSCAIKLIYSFAPQTDWIFSLT